MASNRVRAVGLRKSKTDESTRTTGSVILQVGGIELLTRYSMNTGRATSVLSSLHEFRTHEMEQTGNRQWNWKYLRDQFDQKDLEGLYRKYDDKLREALVYIYISLLILFTTVHITLVVVSTHRELIEWHSTYLSMSMYVLRIAIPALLLWKDIYEPLKRRWFWIPIFVTFVITADLVLTDIIIAIYSSFEGTPLRPAYATMVLLSSYIFLPMRNNYLAIFFGVLVSVIYVLVMGLVTYANDPLLTVVLLSDIIYLAGVNLMGIYFRLMNEVITRRSFLDRRACVESTLRLKFVKDQEERLMLNILPEHIVSKVRQDIRNIFTEIQSHRLSYHMRSFNQLYVEEHDNVSILYADVVNYTMISTTLSPLRMVELLNELFGRFDEASEAPSSRKMTLSNVLCHTPLLRPDLNLRPSNLTHCALEGANDRRHHRDDSEHDVQRIKFLGDCYYCVSGLPQPNPLHAKCCVDLGLEMIYIIKDVREKRALINIDMRIGVHSGKIFSGLIGIRKWQYDVWSKDVTIASKMESTGKPGKVHVTKQTLELILDHAREYIIEPNFECRDHPFIIEHKLETYLLSRPIKTPLESKPYRRPSVSLNRILKGSKKRLEGRNSSNLRRATSFMDENLVEYQQMLKAADAQMAKEIDDMNHGRGTRSCGGSVVRCIALKPHSTTFYPNYGELSAMTTFYLCVVWELKSSLFEEDSTWNVGLDPRVSHTLSVVFITITLYWVDRTTEYRHRLDHLWQTQLSEEQEEAETMLRVNNMLLENILPAHVVQVYLNLNRSVDELYYEKYENVAVMFASLVDYKLGVESDSELGDRLMLRILDEVISDFDRLLLSSNTPHKVEKIKMAGWTYMAACGLDPNRRDSYDSSSFSSIADRRQNNPYNRSIVVTMVQFAAVMMMQLRNFNRSSFQSFEGLSLRIGISNGEVAAGVVGSQKPLYDIWGHAVNMASRMDSTGEKGRIQADECGILTTYRGKTFVKGAGYIRTYFVPLDEDFNLIKKENSDDFYKSQFNEERFSFELDNILHRSISEYGVVEDGGVANRLAFDVRDDLSDEAASSTNTDQEVQYKNGAIDTYC
ncbi:hypothetical protein EVAR_93171_1 [Eumeta japonica]|uniref:adenylate cyclase n=1 Tax=Eumeta variegata TaxID=151549 RepID=A0A4C1TIU0_EUMVA|nr:hypothetical protein EVAR_93171_1 [Eumeta japonica]